MSSTIRSVAAWGWCALPGEWEGTPLLRSAQQAWVLFRFGALADFPSRKPFDGMQFPVDEIENFARQFVPRWTTTTEIMRAGLLAALERIGPCVVICHSQGGDLSLGMIARRPDLVHHAIALEPPGSPDAALATMPADQHWLYVMGDYIEANPFWADLMERTEATVDDLADAGADAQLMHLPRHGLSGNSHMMMMDRNSRRGFRGHTRLAGKTPLIRLCLTIARSIASRYRSFPHNQTASQTLRRRRFSLRTMYSGHHQPVRPLTWR